MSAKLRLPPSIGKDFATRVMPEDVLQTYLSSRQIRRRGAAQACGATYADLRALPDPWRFRRASHGDMGAGTSHCTSPSTAHRRSHQLVRWATRDRLAVLLPGHPPTS